MNVSRTGKKTLLTGVLSSLFAILICVTATGVAQAASPDYSMNSSKVITINNEKELVVFLEQIENGLIPLSVDIELGPEAYAAINMPGCIWPEK